MKKNVENTDNLLQNLMKFGSDSEILSLFDTIKVQVDDMRSAIQKTKINKPNTRYKFSIDPCLQRILEMKEQVHLELNADIREDKTYRESIKSSVRDLSNENRRDSVRTSAQRNVLSPERKADSEITSQANISRTSRTSIKPPLPPEATVTPFSPPTDRRNIEKKEQDNTVSSSVTSKSQQSRSKSIEDVIDDTIPMPKKQNQEQSRDEGMSPKKTESLNSSIPSDSLNGQLQQNPVNSNGNHISPSPCNPEPQSNTPPHFHNKKIKAFDPSGCVVGEASVPRWPHRIVDISSTELVLTLPELSTLMLVILKDDVMRIWKRIRTAKQYRGVACDAFSVAGNSCIVVSCCSSGGQCVDVLTVHGAILQTYRDDYRQHGRLLFTWPYYICTNNQGEIVVSDCQSRNNLICLGRNGKARYEESMNESVIKDTREMCTDRLGNVLIADKNGNAIHMLGIDGKNKYVVMTSNDGLVSPIAVCLSPFGHLIVTQENGDIKVFKF
ncbi:unnamed protein product [Mytilus edulis]|uniref:Uncharacterized protein n=1 Tax=Mytilus edulis TaxID=6550 RepID=A0A8S3SML1_MYTED|nr:unnamed protein product [Mytilus edulis]